MESIVLNYDLACDILFSLINSKNTHHVVPCIHTIVFHVTEVLPYQNFTSQRKLNFPWCQFLRSRNFVHVRFIPLLVHCCSDKEKETGSHFLLRWRHKSVMFR